MEYIHKPPRIEDYEGSYPDAGQFKYILYILEEIGRASFSNNGMLPLNWTEIKSWSELTAFPLEPWEANLIRDCSVAFVGQYNESKSMTAPPPWYEI